MAEENDNQLEVNVTTHFDGAALKEARTEIEATAEATKEAGTEAATAAPEMDGMASSTEQVGTAAAVATPEIEAMAAAQAQVGEAGGHAVPSLRHMAHAAHGVETAMEGGHMSLIRWAMSLKSLFGLLISNPMVQFATAIGVVAIAIGVWIKKSADARDAIEQDLKALEAANERALNKMKADAEQARYDGLKAQIEGVVESYKTWNAASEKQLHLQKEIAQAQLAAYLADSERREMDAVAGAKGDPVKQAEIKGQFEIDRMKAKHATAEEIAKAEEKQLEDRQAQLNAKAAELAKTWDAATAQQPAAVALAEHLERMKGTARGAGVKSDQQLEADKLKKLRNEKASGGDFPHSKEMELEELEGHEEINRKNKGAAPVFKSSEKDIANLEAMIPGLESKLKMYQDRVGSGKASPADEHMLKQIDMMLERSYAASALKKEIEGLAEKQKAADDAAKDQGTAQGDFNKVAKELAALQKEVNDQKKLLAEKEVARAEREQTAQKQAAVAAARATKDAAYAEDQKRLQKGVLDAERNKVLATTPEEKIRAELELDKAKRAAMGVGENASQADKDVHGSRLGLEAAQTQVKIEQIQKKAQNPAEEELERRRRDAAGNAKSLAGQDFGAVSVAVNKAADAVEKNPENGAAVHALTDAMLRFAKAQEMRNLELKKLAEEQARKLQQLEATIKGTQY